MSSDTASVGFFLKKSTDLFFPQGQSKKGPLSRMRVEMADFRQEAISSFTDQEGKVILFTEYVKLHGLCSNRTHLYLLTTSVGGSGSDHELEASDESRDDSKSRDDSSVIVNDVMLGQASSASADTLSLPLSASCTVSSLPTEMKDVLVPSSALEESGACTSGWLENHRITIQYDFASSSAYSDQVVTVCAFSR